MSRNQNRGPLPLLLTAFAVGCAMMAGMKVVDWLVPDPPTRIEIHTTVSDRFA